MGKNYDKDVQLKRKAEAQRVCDDVAEEIRELEKKIEAGKEAITNEETVFEDINMGEDNIAVLSRADSLAVDEVELKRLKEELADCEKERDLIFIPE